MFEKKTSSVIIYQASSGKVRQSLLPERLIKRFFLWTDSLHDLWGPRGPWRRPFEPCWDEEAPSLSPARPSRWGSIVTLSWVHGTWHTGGGGKGAHQSWELAQWLQTAVGFLGTGACPARHGAHVSLHPVVSPGASWCRSNGKKKRRLSGEIIEEWDRHCLFWF